MAKRPVSMASSELKSIGAIKRERSRRLAKLLVKVMNRYRKRDKLGVYTAIGDEFVALGGIYVKFLQGILLNHKMMRQWQGGNRFKVFEEMDPHPIDIEALMRHELGDEKLRAFSGIQRKPFAAGSFGQVYYGELSGGRRIVIKVLRPHIRQLINYDLRVLGFVTGYMKGGMTDLEVDFKSAFDAFRQATINETNYLEEARFAYDLYEAYQNHPTMLIPKTYLELCTKNIIVQEYLDGLSVAQLLKLQDEGVDPVRYVRETLGSDLDEQLCTLGEATMGGGFFLPYVQGDPHPGNIRLQANNKVGLIDFGIKAAAPSRPSEYFHFIKQYYADPDGGPPDVPLLFANLMKFVAADLYAALQRLSSNTNSKRPQVDLVKEVGQIIQGIFEREKSMPYLESMIAEGRIIKAFNQVANKGNRFGLVARLNELDLLRAMQTYANLVEVLGRRPVVLPEVYKRVVEMVEKEKPEITYVSSSQMPLGQAVEIVSAWLERIATRDPVLFRQLMEHIRQVTEVPLNTPTPEPAS